MTRRTPTAADRRTRRPLIDRRRVALISVRFTMFDPQMPSDFPARMRAHAARCAELLRTRFDVLECPLIEGPDDAAAVAAVLARERVDAIVFAPSMAAPPELAHTALREATAPVLIWNAPSTRRLPDDLGQAAATALTTGVGALMYGNVRVRTGTPAPVITAAHDDPLAVDRLLRTVAGLAEAHAIRGALVLRLGEPIAGYLDVQSSAAELAQLGVLETALDLSTWEALVDEVSEAEAAAELERCRERGWSGDPGPAAIMSGRVARALDRAFEATDAVAGTVNCHGPFFRDNPAIGVTACLGVACQARAGRSVACTGDQPTAITLMVARRLAGAALYCELYAIDIEAGLALVAAGGEGDPAWADPGSPVHLEPNHHYPGRNGPGTAISFPLRRGPATILSLSPGAAAWTIAWATGTIEASRHPRLGGPNGMFRFDSGPVDEAISRWIGSGATHHAALAPGRFDVELPALAGALRIRSARC